MTPLPRLVSRVCSAVLIAGVLGVFPGAGPAMANRGGAPNPADSADVSISKTASEPSVAPGGRVEYTITVANAGPGSAEAVSFTDTLPAGTTLIDATTVAAGATCTLPPVAGVITCQLGTMAAGDTAQFVFLVLVDAATPGGTVLTNTAVATSDSDDPDLTNNSATATTLVRGADLAVTKTAPSVIDPGQPLTYTITISNLGPTAEPAVFLSDPLPAGTLFNQVSPTPACINQAGIVSCQLGPLAAGGQIVVTMQVLVDLATAGGTVLTNTATVGGADVRTDPNPNNNSDSANTTVLGPVVLGVAGDGGPHLAGPGAEPVVAGAELPRTGSRSLDRQITIALALIVAGTSVLTASRRRRNRTS